MEEDEVERARRVFHEALTPDELQRLRDALTEAIAAYTHARRLAGAEPDTAAVARWQRALRALG